MTHEYCVRYRRAFGHEQVRVFQRHFFARRFMRRLTEPQRRWAPIVEVAICRREVGPWVLVERAGVDQ